MIPATNNLLCPVDGQPINEVKVRLVAGLVLLLTVLYIGTDWVLLPVLLMVDFGARSLNKGKYSLLGASAEGVVAALKLPYKPTDQAPKRFAARIGLGFAVLITVLRLLNVPTEIPAVTLAIFAALESLAGFCAGCYVYTYYVRLFKAA